jgi:WD40 repeat protein
MYQLRQFLSALKPTRLGVLFAVLIGFGVGFWQWIQPPRPRVVLETLGERVWIYFSPDGQTLATVVVNNTSAERLLTLWDINSGQKKLDPFQINNIHPSAVAFSRDGRSLACGFGSQFVVWNVASGRQLAIYENEHWIPWYVAFSAEGRLRAIRRDNCLCDVADNKVIAKLAPDRDWEIEALDSNFILVLGKANRVKVWDLVTATLCAEREIPKSREISSAEIKMTPDGRFLVCNGGGWNLFDVIIVDLLTGKIQEFKPEVPPCTGADIAPDGQTVALGWPGYLSGPQKTWWSWFEELVGQQEHRGDHVTLRAFPSGEQLLVLKNCSFPVFSPDGRTLAATGTDGSLQLWDFPIRKPIGKILGLAGLAAVATLLVFNGLGWLRRRKMRLKANLVPNCVPSTK